MAVEPHFYVYGGRGFGGGIRLVGTVSNERWMRARGNAMPTQNVAKGWLVKEVTVKEKSPRRCEESRTGTRREGKLCIVLQKGERAVGSASTVRETLYFSGNIQRKLKQAVTE